MSLVLELERRLVNAWPSFEVELAGDWLLRFAEGYSKRANAATPLVPGAALDPALVDAVTTSYEARGLPACFRLTGIEAPGVDAALDRSGLVPFEPSLTLTAALEPSTERDPSLVLSPVPKPAWVAAAAAAYGGEKGNADILGRILRRVRQPAAFATLNLDGEPGASRSRSAASWASTTSWSRPSCAASGSAGASWPASWAGGRRPARTRPTCKPGKATRSRSRSTGRPGSRSPTATITACRPAGASARARRPPARPRP